MTFGEWLKAKREAAKINQSQLAGALGVPRQTIHNWERNKRLPDKYIEKLAQTLHISLSELREKIRAQRQIRKAISQLETVGIVDPTMQEQVKLHFSSAVESTPLNEQEKKELFETLVVVFRKQLRKRE